MNPHPQTLVVLLRHGRTDWNVRRRIQGRTDVPLNAGGRRDARQAAERLKAEEWHAIYTSPLGRAQQTAQIVGETLGIPCQVRPCLIERAYGALEGTSVRRRSRSRKGTQRRAHVPGMEADHTLRGRAFECLEELALRHPGQRIIAVSHGGLINAFLYHISHGTVGTGITRLANGGLTRVAREGSGQWTIQVLNDTSHLDDPQEPTLSHRPYPR